MTSREQVDRMLTLVPYLRQRDRIPVHEVARDFGVSAKQVILDLNALWFCGLPGGLPGDLIEIDRDALDHEGTVSLSNADYLPRPLSLRTGEAISILVALRVLRQSADSDQAEIIDTVMAKLDAILGGAPEAPMGVEIDHGESHIHRAVRHALRSGTRLRITYASVHRDEFTDRVIEPMRTFVARGHTFVRSWCLTAEDWRSFRLDRINTADTTDDKIVDRNDDGWSEDLFTVAADAPWAMMELSPDAWHIADLPSAYRIDDGKPTGAHDSWTKTVKVYGASTDWLRRLVLAHSCDVRVLEPPDLIQDVAARAREALTAYDSVNHLPEE